MYTVYVNNLVSHVCVHVMLHVDIIALLCHFGIQLWRVRGMRRCADQLCEEEEIKCASVS